MTTTTIDRLAESVAALTESAKPTVSFDHKPRNFPGGKAMNIAGSNYMVWSIHRALVKRPAGSSSVLGINMFAIEKVSRLDKYGSTSEKDSTYILYAMLYIPDGSPEVDPLWFAPSHFPSIEVAEAAANALLKKSYIETDDQEVATGGALNFLQSLHWKGKRPGATESTESGEMSENTSAVKFKLGSGQPPEGGRMVRSMDGTGKQAIQFARYVWSNPPGVVPGGPEHGITGFSISEEAALVPSAPGGLGLRGFRLMALVSLPEEFNSRGSGAYVCKQVFETLEDATDFASKTLKIANKHQSDLELLVPSALFVNMWKHTSRDEAVDAGFDPDEILAEGPKAVNFAHISPAMKAEIAGYFPRLDVAREIGAVINGGQMDGGVKMDFMGIITGKRASNILAGGENGSSILKHNGDHWLVLYDFDHEDRMMGDKFYKKIAILDLSKDESTDGGSMSYMAEEKQNPASMENELRSYGARYASWLDKNKGRVQLAVLLDFVRLVVDRNKFSILPASEASLDDAVANFAFMAGLRAERLPPVVEKIAIPLQVQAVKEYDTGLKARQDRVLVNSRAEFLKHQGYRDESTLAEGKPNPASMENELRSYGARYASWLDKNKGRVQLAVLLDFVRLVVDRNKLSILPSSEASLDDAVADFAFMAGLRAEQLPTVVAKIAIPLQVQAVKEYDTGLKARQDRVYVNSRAEFLKHQDSRNESTLAEGPKPKGSWAGLENMAKTMVQNAEGSLKYVGVLRGQKGESALMSGSIVKRSPDGHYLVLFDHSHQDDEGYDIFSKLAVVDLKNEGLKTEGRPALTDTKRALAKINEIWSAVSAVGGYMRELADADPELSKVWPKISGAIYDGVLALRHPSTESVNEEAGKVQGDRRILREKLIEIYRGLKELGAWKDTFQDSDLYSEWPKIMGWLEASMRRFRATSEVDEATTSAALAAAESLLAMVDGPGINVAPAAIGAGSPGLPVSKMTPPNTKKLNEVLKFFLGNQGIWESTLASVLGGKVTFLQPMSYGPDGTSVEINAVVEGPEIGAPGASLRFTDDSVRLMVKPQGRLGAATSSEVSVVEFCTMHPSKMVAAAA